MTAMCNLPHNYALERTVTRQWLARRAIGRDCARSLGAVAASTACFALARARTEQNTGWPVADKAS